MIRYATLDDAPDAHRIIREIAEWLIAKGEPLWGADETSYETLEAIVRAGELVIGRLSGKTVACMFLHRADTKFWPEDAPGEALYLHRLAVTRKFAGRGLAHAMLNWAESETRAAGRNYLRLDCVPRAKLIRIYEMAGFVRVDPGPVKVGAHWVIRQQKRV